MRKISLFALFIACALCSFAEQWAQVNIPVAHIRALPGNKNELTSQELMGLPVKLEREENGWWHIEGPDGYHGWMRAESVVEKTDEQMRRWRSAPRLVVASRGQITCYDSPTGDGPRQVVTDLVPNSIVEGSLADARHGRVPVTLPDGRKAWAPADAMVTIEEWASQPYDPQKILDRAYSMLGAPYLWGGASSKAVDCSGLVKTSYLANGIFLRRDASLQINTGKKLDRDDWSSWQPCDLIFFGNRATGKVTHVALHDHDGTFIHSTGTGDRVRVNSVVPGHPLHTKIQRVGAVRINGMVNTPGIVKADAHPWLFNL